MKRKIILFLILSMIFLPSTYAAEDDLPFPILADQNAHK